MTGRASNRGATTLKLRRRATDPMRDYDRLPLELRTWLAQAARPWSPISVRRAFARALAAKGDRAQALAELDRLEAHRIARDALGLWGRSHPAALDHLANSRS
ncbi:DUF6525 family protein [Rhodovulum euryhalinum]|uniref:Uncharacterized protein n=1 Tax=Rhodovulum euryhalinum TaxID=35805 RepID=A0A4V2SAX1_9RHOB|nr:DUF6525 family protein [Rhodovulum euryhalinum]TCO73270.1 hypothetical protein EV655_10233 [Rhodovulum euryhalinum]